MAGLRSQQRTIELRERRIDRLKQGLQAVEAFAGACFDDGTDEQSIDDRVRLPLANQRMQARRVSGCGNTDIRFAAFFEQRDNLFEVPQLFAREPRHLVQQRSAEAVADAGPRVARCGAVLPDEPLSLLCSLKLKRGVIEQQRLPAADRLIEPCRRCTAGQERQDGLNIAHSRQRTDCLFSY
jgi:hypothetical protein